MPSGEWIDLLQNLFDSLAAKGLVAILAPHESEKRSLHPGDQVDSVIKQAHAQATILAQFDCDTGLPLSRTATIYTETDITPIRQTAQLERTGETAKRTPTGLLSARNWPHIG